MSNDSEQTVINIATYGYSNFKLPFIGKKYLLPLKLTTLVGKKCIPYKDLARVSCTILQVIAFLCKTFPCKIRPRRKIS